MIARLLVSVRRLSIGTILAGALFFSAIASMELRAAVPTELFFSEYVEGSSNNRTLEIYNGTGSSIGSRVGEPKRGWPDDWQQHPVAVQPCRESGLEHLSGRLSAFAPHRVRHDHTVGKQRTNPER